MKFIDTYRRSDVYEPEYSNVACAVGGTRFIAELDKDVASWSQ